MNDHAPFVNLRVGVGKFYYGSGCIRVLPEEVTRLGGKPFVIGGPTTTPLVKVNNTKDLGANVVLQGETFDDAAAFRGPVPKAHRP